MKFSEFKFKVRVEVYFQLQISEILWILLLFWFCQFWALDGLITLIWSGSIGNRVNKSYILIMKLLDFYITQADSKTGQVGRILAGVHFCS